MNLSRRQWARFLPALATPAQGPLVEAICTDNPNSFFAGEPAMPIPQAVERDF